MHVVFDMLKYSGVDVKPERISLWFTKGDGSQLATGVFKLRMNCHQFLKSSLTGSNAQNGEVMQLLKDGTPIRFDEKEALGLLQNTGTFLFDCITLSKKLSLARHDFSSYLLGFV